MAEHVLRDLAAMKEKELREEVLIPLLNKTPGIYQVTDVHGANEKGLDIIFFTRDPVRPRCYGLQLKRGDIAGGGSSSRTVQQIVTQLELAKDFSHPVAVPPAGRYKIDTFIVATNGRISGTANEEIASRARPTPVEFWDQNELMRRISEIYPELLSSADLATVDYLRGIRARCETLDSLDQITGVASHTLSEVYIEPLLKRRFDPTVASVKGDPVTHPPIPVFSLVEERDDLVLLGEQDSGKTASFRMLAIQSVDQLLSSPDEGARIPVLFRASDVIERGSVREAAQNAVRLLGAEKLGTELGDDGDELSGYWFLVDGFSELPSNELKTTCSEMLEQLRRTTRVRVAVAGRTDDFLHPKYFNTFTHYTIEPFSSSQVQSLVSKWTSSDTGVQDVANKLVTRVREALQLPGSPIPAIIGVMLYEREKQFITNTAEAVDRYMVIRLGRYAQEMGLAMSVPWNRKQDLLAEVAFKMVQEGKDSLTSERVVQIMDARYEALGEDSQSLAAVEELVEAGVLRRDGDDLTFFRTAFRDFFAGHWVHHNSEDFAKFFETRLFDRRWGPVLVFAAGLRRRNGELLARLNAKVREQVQQISVAPSEDYVYGAYLLGRILSNSEATEEPARLDVLRTCVGAACDSAAELAKEVEEQFGPIGQVVGLIGSEHTLFVAVGVPWLRRQFAELSAAADLSEEERYLVTSVYSNLGAENWLDVLAGAVRRARRPRVLVALSVLLYQLDGSRQLKGDERGEWVKIQRVLDRKKRRVQASIEELMTITDPLLKIEQQRMQRLEGKRH